MTPPHAPLTREAPFGRRLRAYLQERFPLLGHGLLIVSYYSSNQFLARAITRPGEPMSYDAGSLLGALTVLCVFFHLRVFDEHKDYEEDLEHYPDRVLQSGLITLRELRVVGGVAIGFELLASAVWSLAALVSVVIVIAFSLLMLVEFFAGPWLRRHFLIYALSHMLIMPLLAMVPFSFATGQFAWEAPPWYWLYAFVGFFVTLNWEISRKIHAPEDEREGVDSYTKVFGTYGAAYAVIGVRVIDTAMVAALGVHLELRSWFYIVLVLLFGLSAISFFRFRFYTNSRTAKQMETFAGMYIIAFDLTLALALVSKFGIALHGGT